jgi:hypothetical protein
MLEEPSGWQIATRSWWMEAKKVTQQRDSGGAARPLRFLGSNKSHYIIMVTFNS